MNYNLSSKLYGSVSSMAKEGQGDCILFLEEMIFRFKRFNERELLIDSWILKVENIEIKVLVLMATQLQQPWLVPTAYFLQFFGLGHLKRLLVDTIIKIINERGDIH